MKKRTIATSKIDFQRLSGVSCQSISSPTRVRGKTLGTSCFRQSQAAIAMSLLRMRRRFGDILLRLTVDDPADAEDELRRLMSIARGEDEVESYLTWIVRFFLNPVIDSHNWVYTLAASRLCGAP